MAEEPLLLHLRAEATPPPLGFFSDAAPAPPRRRQLPDSKDMRGFSAATVAISSTLLELGAKILGGTTSAGPACDDDGPRVITGHQVSNADPVDAADGRPACAPSAR